MPDLTSCFSALLTTAGHSRKSRAGAIAPSALDAFSLFSSAPDISDGFHPPAPPQAKPDGKASRGDGKRQPAIVLWPGAH